MNMPAGSENINSNSMESYRRLDYTNDIQYLELCVCDATLFEESELGEMYFLDMSKCVIGKRKKKYNPMNLYDIFASYTDISGTEVKDLVLKEIHDNIHWYRRVGHVPLGM